VGAGTLATPATANELSGGQLHGGLDSLGVLIGAVDELPPQPLPVAAHHPPAPAVEEFAAGFKAFGIGGQAEEIVGGCNQGFSDQSSEFREPFFCFITFITSAAAPLFG